MKRTPIGLSCLLLALAGGALVGCESTPSAPLAPSASALAPTKPAASAAKKFSVDKATSKVEFMMDAPQEKIRGRVPAGLEGDLQVDLADLTKTTGLLTVDISGIELFQAKADDAGKFGEETKSDLQNTHAKTWLEISDDAPEDARKKNSKVDFAVRSIESVSEKDVTKMTGATRKVTLQAKGEFLLHGRKAEKTAELEAVFTFDGDKPVSVAVKTVKPISIGLAEHDVRPRDKFGSLAQKTLEVLAPKVAKDAMVSLDFNAKLSGP
jgi:polyisoprenoid-binding protein YceI